MSDIDEQDWLSRLDTAPSAEAVRMVAVIRIEYGLLAVRYVSLLLIVGWASVGGISAVYSSALPAVVLTIVAQCVFAHWVLYQQKYRLFVSPVNFAVNLAGICVLVGATGGDQSPLVLLFALFIIGYGIYAPRFLSPFFISLVCCIVYSFTLLAYWSFEGVNLTSPPVWFRLGLILLCGWMVGVLSDALRHYQQSALQQTAALASSESALRAILDSVGHPLLVYDEHGFITDANDEACDFLGLPRLKLLGKRFRAFIFDDGTLPSRLAVLRARGQYQGELIALTDSGEERDIDLLARSFTRDGQRFHVALMRDITRQKELQESARIARNRLEEANRTLQQATELHATFLTSVSQRLRSPLSAILGFAELLLEGALGELNDAQRGAVASCRRTVQRMFKTINEPFEMPGQPAAEKRKTAPEPAGSVVSDQENREETANDHA